MSPEHVFAKVNLRVQKEYGCIAKHQKIARKGTSVKRNIWKELAVANASIFLSNYDQMKNLGADYVFNYKTDNIESTVLEITNGKGVDRMVDVEFGANLELAPKLIKSNGCLTAYGSDAIPIPKIPFYDFMFKNITIQAFSIFGMPEKAKVAAFKYINQMLETGSLDHRIDNHYSFDEMVIAHENIERNNLSGSCLVSI